MDDIGRCRLPPRPRNNGDEFLAKAFQVFASIASQDDSSVRCADRVELHSKGMCRGTNVANPLEPCFVMLRPQSVIRRRDVRSCRKQRQHGNVKAVRGHAEESASGSRLDLILNLCDLANSGLI